MGYITDLSNDEHAEDITPLIRFRIVDEDNVAVPGSNLDTLTITLFDERTGAVINNRSDVDILGVNGGSVDANGDGEWILTTDDMAIINSRRRAEIHIVLFTWRWTPAGSTQRTGRWKVKFKVKNLTRV